MASISKRHTASGQVRYDVRYRAGGRAIEETFRRRRDAENRVRQIEAEKLRGHVVDPRRGRRSSQTSPSAGSRRGRSRAGRSPP